MRYAGLIRKSPSLRIRIIVAALCLISLVALDRHKTHAQGSSDGRLLAFDLGDTHLTIPRNYFLPAPPPEGKTEDLFIIALMPEMAPMREDNKRDFLYPNPRGHGQTVNILFKDAHKTTSIEFRLNVETKLGAPYARDEDRYGLQALLPVNDGANDRRRRQELFIEGTQASPRAFIWCDRNGTVPYPICAETFVYHGFLVQADYGKNYLADWQRIEGEISALLNGFMGAHN